MRYLRTTLAVCLGALALTGCKPASDNRGAAPPISEAAPLISLPPAPLLSPKGYQLILDYEVGGGQAYYSRFLASPTWPGASSGVTVGVGYDCGYNSKPVIVRDWAGMPNTAYRERLGNTAGVKGQAAKSLVQSVGDIVIDWRYAEAVFNDVTINRYHQLTQRTYPGFERLHGNAQAALVSLTFNRGSSMTGDRRKEMRDIRDCAARQDYAGMARANRASIRVWKGSSIEKGMARRREAEARLMEGG